jgi:hypothetical protein
LFCPAAAARHFIRITKVEQRAIGKMNESDYLVSWMKRYRNIEISIEDACATGLIDVWRTEIKLHRSIKKKNNNEK